MGCEAGKYAKVTLGTRRLQGEPVYKVSLRLHRFACWLGKGDMPTEPATGKVWNMVTHQCSLKHCLALAHLEWGTASSNRVEHLLQANWKLEEQGKPRNKKRWVGPGTGFPAAVKPFQLFRCRGVVDGDTVSFSSHCTQLEQGTSLVLFGNKACSTENS